MKKIYIGIVVSVIFASFLYAGHLTSESISGNYKTCYYSDGQVLSIPYTSYCPLYN